MTASRAIQKRVFAPGAKKSRSNFPRFDSSKRGFCARDARRTPRESHSRFPRRRARFPRDFPRHRRAVWFSTPIFTPPKKRGGNENRRFPRSNCTYRATDRRSVKQAPDQQGVGGWPGHPLAGSRCDKKRRLPRSIRRFSRSVRREAYPQRMSSTHPHPRFFFRHLPATRHSLSE